jgi:hypothetical protein
MILSVTTEELFLFFKRFSLGSQQITSLTEVDTARMTICQSAKMS